jgi:hypothetical protein
VTRHGWTPESGGQLTRCARGRNGAMRGVRKKP